MMLVIIFQILLLTEKLIPPTKSKNGASMKRLIRGFKMDPTKFKVF